MKERIDLHMHTTVSDGSNTPEEILECVKKAGITVFAVTDHDAVKGCGIIRGLLREGDPQFFNGTEFSCRDEQGMYHILGYAYDAEAESIRDLISLGHSLRMKKVVARLDFIKTQFGCVFPEEEIRALLAMDNPGKPHIGNLMVKYGYAESRDQAIREVIDQLHLHDEHVRPEQAISGILAGGGIPVLAHPFYGSGDELIMGEEMENRLTRLIGFGLQGVEAYYSGFPPKLTRQMLSLADRLDLFVTAGSDYHGTNKMIRLGNTGLPREKPLVPRLEKFLSAARERSGY